MKTNVKNNQNCDSGHTSLCHPELVSGSMVGSAWRVGKNLDGLCQRTNGFRTKSGMTGECGRSMVEMLGVLAIIGVLSVGGIAGYTTAMNKHRANEILNAASVRAMVVSTQIQNGSTSPTLAEFTDNKVGSATFGTDVKNTAGTGAWTKGTDNQFSLTLSGVDKAVCDQMKAIVGDNGIIKDWGTDCDALTYNNDLTNTDPTPAGEPDPCDSATCNTANGEVCINQSGTAVCTQPKSGSECTKNSDCSSVAECQGKTCYCAITATYDNSLGSCYKDYTGTCTVTTAGDKTPVSGTSFFTGPYMTWWSAQNFCKAHGTSMVKLSDLKCSLESIDLMKSKGLWGCCKNGTDCTEFEFGPPETYSTKMTDEFNALAPLAFVGKYTWLYDEWDSCSIFQVTVAGPDTGIVNHGGYTSPGYALCK